MRNIRIRLAYDGTNYCGWQMQSNGMSIQAIVEKAILDFTGTSSSVIAAGRTDAGVHAIGQVAHFHTQSQIPLSKFRAGLQSYLPRDIVVLAADEVSPHFHARYQAIRKRYRYVIDNSLRPLPFLDKYAYRQRGELDVAAMHAAGQVLVGEHDFRCFESRWPNRPTSVRTIEELTVKRTTGWPIWSEMGSCPATTDDPTGSFITLDVVADGFLYNMVRSITGTLLEVGRGKWSASDVKRILTAQDRALAGATVPSQGLYLVHVDYGPESLGNDERTDLGD